METVAELRKRRIRTSKSALSRFFGRHDITLQKKACKRRNGSEQTWLARADAGSGSKACLTPLAWCSSTRLSTNMVRLRGRASRGVRLIGRVPLGNWETITFVAALRHNKLTAPMVLEGAMSGEMFRAYVEQCLVPALKRGDVVVMDNFAAHKVPGVREAIEKAGATLRYLPKYSPDLNPIELPYSKFKDHLRKAAERTVRGLYRTIRAFVPQLGARECANYFRHAGYVSI
jgi:transposase